MKSLKKEIVSQELKSMSHVVVRHSARVEPRENRWKRKERFLRGSRPGSLKRIVTLKICPSCSHSTFHR